MPTIGLLQRLLYRNITIIISLIILGFVLWFTFRQALLLHQREAGTIPVDHRHQMGLGRLLAVKYDTKKASTSEAAGPRGAEQRVHHNNDINATLNKAVENLMRRVPKNGTFMMKKWHDILLSTDTTDVDQLRRQASRRHSVTIACAVRNTSRIATPFDLISDKKVNLNFAAVKLSQAYIFEDTATNSTEPMKSKPGAPGNVSESSDNKVCERRAASDSYEIFVNDDFGLLYCSVPKVACTQWKRILLALTGKMNVSRLDDIPNTEYVHTYFEQRYLKRLSQYSPVERCHRLKTYFKFMFVRDPMERLLSTYRNKFLDPVNQHLYSSLNKRIIAKYRDGESAYIIKQKGAESFVATFQEFVKFVIDQEDMIRKFKNVTFLNPHWRPMHELCLPCDIEYDFIGKYETLEEDSNWLLRMIWKDSNNYTMTFPQFDSRRAKTSKLVESSFANISQIDMLRLRAKYLDDYKMFNY